MRDDQRQRLAELSEKLCEVVLEEADPDFWPGKGQPLDQMNSSTRGDRYWCKKNATASISLLLKVEQLSQNTKEAGGRDPRTEDETDDAITAAERRAKQLLQELQGRVAGKA